jgi:hypothetical protein
MEKIINKLTTKEKQCIWGAIGVDNDSPGMEYTVFNVDSKTLVQRRMYEDKFTLRIVDYVINDNGGNWILEGWQAIVSKDAFAKFLPSIDMTKLLSEPELNSIFGGSRKPGERRFECFNISLTSKEEALQTAFRITQDDVDCVLTDCFSEVDKMNFYKKYNTIEARNKVINDSLCESWYENVRETLSAILG